MAVIPQIIGILFRIVKSSSKKFLPPLAKGEGSADRPQKPGYR
jgi:hypothetical protein